MPWPKDPARAALASSRLSKSQKARLSTPEAKASLKLRGRENWVKNRDKLMAGLSTRGSAWKAKVGASTKARWKTDSGFRRKALSNLRLNRNPLRQIFRRISKAVAGKL